MLKRLTFVFCLSTAACFADDDDAKTAAGKTGTNDKAATSAPDSESDLADTVKQLVRKLDAPQKARREEAEKDLVALGSKVLDYLP